MACLKVCSIKCCLGLGLASVFTLAVLAHSCLQWPLEQENHCLFCCVVFCLPLPFGNSFLGTWVGIYHTVALLTKGRDCSFEAESCFVLFHLLCASCASLALWKGLPDCPEKLGVQAGFSAWGRLWPLPARWWLMAGVLWIAVLIQLAHVCLVIVGGRVCMRVFWLPPLKLANYLRLMLRSNSFLSLSAICCLL